MAENDENHKDHKFNLKTEIERKIHIHRFEEMRNSKHVLQAHVLVTYISSPLWINRDWWNLFLRQSHRDKAQEWISTFQSEFTKGKRVVFLPSLLHSGQNICFVYVAPENNISECIQDILTHAVKNNMQTITMSVLGGDDTIGIYTSQLVASVYERYLHIHGITDINLVLNSEETLEITWNTLQDCVDSALQIMEIVFHHHKDDLPEKSISCADEYGKSVRKKHLFCHAETDIENKLSLIVQRMFSCDIASKQVCHGEKEQIVINNLNRCEVVSQDSSIDNNSDDELDFKNNLSETSDPFTCMICREFYQQPESWNCEKCQHIVCQKCAGNILSRDGNCPFCHAEYCWSFGPQPPDGIMWYSKDTLSLPGYPGHGTIIVNYQIPDGIQQHCHPNPGKWYKGINRTAFLPDTDEGRKIYRLLKAAFEKHLVFTVGASLSKGIEDVITWSDIPHKTNRNGGPTKFGYPDSEYLKEVQDVLIGKGLMMDCKENNELS